MPDFVCCKPEWRSSSSWAWHGACHGGAINRRLHNDTNNTPPAATPTSAPKAASKPHKPLPAPNSDFYEVYESLKPEELAIVKRVRAFMESSVAPVITKYWCDDAFPFELLPGVKALNIGGLGMHGYGWRREAWLSSDSCKWNWLESTRRSQPSLVCTSAWRWARSTSMARKNRSRNGCRQWRAWKRSDALGLPNRWPVPAHRAGLPPRPKAGDGEHLDPQTAKNAGSATQPGAMQMSIIWAAAMLMTNQVKGFIVENKTTPGFSVDKIENKIAP